MDFIEKFSHVQKNAEASVAYRVKSIKNYLIFLLKNNVYKVVT